MKFQQIRDINSYLYSHMIKLQLNITVTILYQGIPSQISCKYYFKTGLSDLPQWCPIYPTQKKLLFYLLPYGRVLPDVAGDTG